MMNIYILLAYGGGSHEAWANTIERNSKHRVTTFQLPGRHWKWRMHGASSYFANLINLKNDKIDLILTTSMMNVAEFKGLLNTKHRFTPVHLYFHENQFAYPISSNDPDKKTERMEHFQFIQLQSFISADEVYFNSQYNRKTFLDGANQLLKKLPDFKNHLITGLQRPSKIWKIFIDINEFDLSKRKGTPGDMVFIWNHRWEDDKNPKDFFSFLKKIKDQGFKIKIIICGKPTAHPEFKKAKVDFRNEIIHFAEAVSRDEYLSLLYQATHSVITSNHDFYGISALELILSGVKTFFPNRLAYPEHFKNELWCKINYSNLDDFSLERLACSYPSRDEILNNLNIPVNEFKDL